MGLRRLGEVFALPRPELARRLGPDLLGWLDRLRGQSVEPCPPYRPPTQFFQRIAFDYAIQTNMALQFALRRLCRELAAFRSGERRVGKGCVSTCRSRWLAYH